jgi:hypothetical protein
MVSRVCTSFDKLVKESEDCFQVNLSLMGRMLESKTETVTKVAEDFVWWERDNQDRVNILNERYCQRLQGLCA